jgi:hypothetical protein
LYEDFEIVAIYLSFIRLEVLVTAEIVLLISNYFDFTIGTQLLQVGAENVLCVFFLLAVVLNLQEKNDYRMAWASWCNRYRYVAYSAEYPRVEYGPLRFEDLEYWLDSNTTDRQHKRYRL